MSNQINANDTVMGSELGGDIIPPVDRRAEAVKQQNGWSLSFYPDVCWLNAGVDNLAAVTRRRRSCARIDPNGVCCEQPDDNQNQPEPPDLPTSSRIGSCLLTVAHFCLALYEDLFLRKERLDLTE
jgi:hypothetical protein